MAENAVGASGAVPIDRPSTVEGVVGGADELIRQAPEPSEKAKKVYRVLYPTDHFVVPGHPVVTTAGVPLTDDQAKVVLPAAEASSVKIVEVGE
jgi:hypothetical protein